MPDDEAMRAELGASARRRAATRAIRATARRREQAYLSVYAGRLRAVSSQ